MATQNGRTKRTTKTEDGAEILAADDDTVIEGTTSETTPEPETPTETKEAPVEEPVAEAEAPAETSATEEPSAVVEEPTTEEPIVQEPSVEIPIEEPIEAVEVVPSETSYSEGVIAACVSRYGSYSPEFCALIVAGG